VPALRSRRGRSALLRKAAGRRFLRTALRAFEVVGVKDQELDRAPAVQVLVHDALDVFDGDAAVPHVVGRDVDGRAGQARLEATGRDDLVVEVTLLALQVAEGRAPLGRAAR